MTDKFLGVVWSLIFSQTNLFQIVTATEISFSSGIYFVMLVRLVQPQLKKFSSKPCTCRVVSVCSQYSFILYYSFAQGHHAPSVTCKNFFRISRNHCYFNVSSPKGQRDNNQIRIALYCSSFSVVVSGESLFTSRYWITIVLWHILGELLFP